MVLSSSIPVVPLFSGSTAMSTVLLLGVFALFLLGAEIFTNGVEWLGHRPRVGSPTGSPPGAVLSRLRTPLSTERPEKFNSDLWVSRDTDPLALDKSTGAIAFHRSILITLGILFTSWLSFHWDIASFLNAVSAILAIVCGVIFSYRLHSLDTKRMQPAPFLVGGQFYLLPIGGVLYHVFALGLTNVAGH
ncbi:hypothetical protein [Halocatena marina]|uniref:hypothetical protein n=1 Tax=Halocatena marina TaxID=2934937 RepID=UPI00200FBC5F|nr:hypothetical protein [Halocatena marina]